MLAPQLGPFQLESLLQQFLSPAAVVVVEATAVLVVVVVEP
jgi:hypothetical protein